MMIIWGQLDFWGLMDMFFNYSLEKEKLKMKKKNKNRDGIYFYLFIIEHTLYFIGKYF